ncbi:P-loop containing nucleoside triphosphate hydrolase protein [Leucogyrophana mollusca]|uniref:P-loop containing nucleoside triphosphate hydrolase protein n=1 Tax=Leucogyrophana mollusca TaxID=85980 RepID=A0ACB8BP48_9AGAM|nr:P-loop containing nucleoside triphosphate hydrolase protein [Leucogyrophana mollusca]
MTQKDTPKNKQGKRDKKQASSLDVNAGVMAKSHSLRIQRSSPPRRASGKEIANGPRLRNVIVFGESGVGKSSLINLIAEKPVAKTSSDAVGCTFGHVSYPMEIEGETYMLWDTAGLDEGTSGTIPAAKAEEQLRIFLRGLTPNGIDLLIYCVRGTRIRKALLRNYTIFYSAICRKKVPVVLVVTGLENSEGDMEEWWVTNERELRKHRMYFVGHACVTTLSAESTAHPILLARREKSRQAVQELIVKTSRNDPWKADGDNWMKKAIPGVLPLLNMKWDGQRQSVPIVVVWNPVQQVPNTQIAPGICGKVKAFTLHTDIRPYKFYPVFSPDSSELKSNKDNTVEGDADLLIFYIQRDKPDIHWQEMLQSFSDTYGGEMTPVIIVLTGIDSQQSLEDWRKDLSDTQPGGTVVANATFTYYPHDDSAKKSREEAGQRLMRLIDERCLDTASLRVGWVLKWMRFFRKDSLPPKKRAEKALSRSQIRMNTL